MMEKLKKNILNLFISVIGSFLIGQFIEYILGETSVTGGHYIVMAVSVFMSVNAFPFQKYSGKS